MMTSEPRFWAVIIIGPPGAGKDTQADFLSEELGLVQIKSSKLIEAKINKPDLTDPVLIEEKRKWATGELNDRDWVNSILLEAIEEVRKEHVGVVFSGSPRDIREVSVQFPKLEEIYGRENIKTISLRVSDEESINRNSHRRICQANRHPIPNLPEYKDITVCPKDGSPIITRVMDTVETIKKRLDVYRAETLPVLDYIKDQGYNIIEINGEQSIEDVHRDILNKLW
jgi:adenylate kinase